MDSPLPPLEPIDLASPSPISTYLRSMTPVCPFIEPADGARLLFVSEIAPDCATSADIHARLFEQLVPQIERFRQARKALVEKQSRLLVCHTVIIRMPPGLDGDTVKQLNWPNLLGWSLKHLYTPKEIVLGTVRKGVAEVAQFGLPIPVAPFHAVIIRSRVVGSDKRFFPGNDLMLKAMMEADDDGANTLGAMLGTVPDIQNPRAIRDDNTWQRVVHWFQKNAPKK